MKKQLVFATGNAHKVLEVNQILEATPFIALPMSEKGVHEDIPETGSTMEENAWQKAHYLVNKLGTDCFAEDSGLEITALDMEPGIYTARYAGPQRDHDDNMDKVLRKLEGKSDRSAQFRAVVALSIAGERHTFEGIVKGRIAKSKQGNGGFGYDPIFIPDGYDPTFAELPDHIKNSISHRARAIEAMSNFLIKRELAIPSIVSVDWLLNQSDNDKVVILDASTPTVGGTSTNHKEEYIPRSIKVDLKTQFSDPTSALPNTFPDPAITEKHLQALGIDQDSVVVIYDNLGVYSSPRMWFIMKTLGHQNVAVLDGGLPEWKRQGYPLVEESATSSKLGNFKASLSPKWIKSKSEIFQNLAHQAFQLIDARSAGRFEGSEPEPRAGLRGGHIPQSVCLAFENVLKDGKFRSKDERQKIWDALKIDRAVSFTCGSGMTACIDFVAFYDIAHVPMSIYDGSWTEWALDPSMPTEY